MKACSVFMVFLVATAVKADEASATKKLAYAKSNADAAAQHFGEKLDYHNGKVAYYNDTVAALAAVYCCLNAEDQAACDAWMKSAKEYIDQSSGHLSTAKKEGQNADKNLAIANGFASFELWDDCELHAQVSIDASNKGIGASFSSHIAATEAAYYLNGVWGIIEQ